MSSRGALSLVVSSTFFSISTATAFLHKSARMTGNLLCASHSYRVRYRPHIAKTSGFLHYEPETTVSRRLQARGILEFSREQLSILRELVSCGSAAEFEQGLALGRALCQDVICAEEKDADSEVCANEQGFSDLRLRRTCDGTAVALGASAGVLEQR